MTKEPHSQAYTLRKPKLKDTHVSHCSLQHYLQQNMEATQMSIDRWIKKLRYIYTMECYSAIKRNTLESVLMRWMNLEPIIQSEVGQKNKYKYHILMHLHRIQEYGTEEFIYRAAMEKQTQRIDLWTWGRGEEGEMQGKSNMQTYITICKRDSQLEFAVWLRKLEWGSVSTQRSGMGREMGRMFKREGIYISLWLIHTEV